MLTPNATTFRRAVIETAVIAVGVFVALAADNWNESRKERQLEQGFFDGIVLDLQLNTERVEQTVRTAAGLRGSLERVLHALQTGEHEWESPTQFEKDLILCTYLGTPTLSSITLDELQSTGSMRLIRDADFRRKLASYYSDFWLDSQFHPEYRRKEAAIEEALLGFLPLNARLRMRLDDAVPSGELDVEETLEQLRRIPDLVPRLEDMIWVQNRMMSRYDWIIEDGRALIADIESMR